MLEGLPTKDAKYTCLDTRIIELNRFERGVRRLTWIMCISRQVREQNIKTQGAIT